LSETPQFERNTSTSYAIRPGTTLEGRLSAYLERLGYHATMHYIRHEHEIDVWGERDDGQTIAVECKEYYSGEGISLPLVRDFFAKVHDLRELEGVPTKAMFVTIGTFNETAREYLDRRGIIAVDGDDLVLLEKDVKKIDEIVISERKPQDTLILQLRDEVRRLRRELERRVEIADLSSQLEDLRVRLDMATLPTFFHPASLSTHVWYSDRFATPFVGLQGRFKDFFVVDFPIVQKVVFTTSGFWGEKQKMAAPGQTRVEQGQVTFIEGIREDVAETYYHETVGGYALNSYLNRAVYTLDGTRLGEVTDFCLGAPKGLLRIQAVMIRLEERLRSDVKEETIVIPADRLVFERDCFKLLATLSPRGIPLTCKFCGARIKQGAIFCDRCGRSLV